GRLPGGRLPDRQPLREVGEPDARGDEDRQPLRGRKPWAMRTRELGHRGRAWPEHRLSLPRLDPTVVVDEAHQADDEAGQRDRGDACEVAPVSRVERALDRIDRLCEDVPEQEQQNPGRGRREERLDLRRAAVHPAHGQADEDRQAGDRAEQECLSGAHLVRVTLQNAPVQLTRMAQGHSVDEYLETIYFLAFPIGEYRPQSTGSPTLASRVAEMLGVS